MTLDDLKARPDFIVGLGEQQKAFVIAFCNNGADKLAAARGAYACNTDQSATTTANRALAHPTIKKLIADYFNVTEESGSKEALAALLWKRLNDGNTDQKCWLPIANLYAEVKGFKTERTPAPTPGDGDEDWVSRLEKVKGS